MAAIEAMTPKRSNGLEIVKRSTNETPNNEAQNILLCLPAAEKASLRTRIACERPNTSAAS
jgi:hypothetical protein